MLRGRATWPTACTDLREQRPENDLRALVDRLLAQPAARSAALPASSFTSSWMSGLVEFRERQFGGILHRLRGEAGIATGRQRQDQRDLDLAAADRAPRLRRPGADDRRLG